MKRIEVLNLNESIKALAQTKVPSKLAYALAINAKRIEPYIEAYDKAKDAIVGENKEVLGKYTETIMDLRKSNKMDELKEYVEQNKETEALMGKVNTEYMEFLNGEADEVTFHKVGLDQLPETIEPMYVTALMPMLE